MTKPLIPTTCWRCGLGTVFLFFALAFQLPAQVNDLRSTLRIHDLDTGTDSTVYTLDGHFEAPNWSPDGRYLLFNREGRLYRFTFASGEVTELNTAFADRLNNDHGISADGSLVVFSHNDPTVETPPGEAYRSSRIYTVPAEGGRPTAVTPLTPSFWHGISPDGKTLVYTAMRDDTFNIYAIPTEGGKEVQLTDQAGLDDGPEFSPDGAYVYYNSMASGKMEIWRMRPDGTEPEQLTDDAYSNWFAHPDPTGRYFVYIAYLEDQGDRHPPMKDVALRLYDLPTGSIRTLVELTGGQGTINVPSWSPDGRRFAYVAYERL